MWNVQHIATTSCTTSHITPPQASHSTSHHHSTPHQTLHITPPTLAAQYSILRCITTFKSYHHISYHATNQPYYTRPPHLAQFHILSCPAHHTIFQITPYQPHTSHHISLHVTYSTSHYHILHHHMHNHILHFNHIIHHSTSHHHI